MHDCQNFVPIIALIRDCSSITLQKNSVFLKNDRWATLITLKSNDACYVCVYVIFKKGLYAILNLAFFFLSEYVCHYLYYRIHVFYGCAISRLVTAVTRTRIGRASCSYRPCRARVSADAIRLASLSGMTCKAE